MEAEVEKLNTEMIAEKNIYFEFEEQLEIYCRLRLEVPKTIQQQIREHVILSVVIPNFTTGKDYVGTGVIKRVQVSRGGPNLTVWLQIDVLQPLDKNRRQ